MKKKRDFLPIAIFLFALLLLKTTGSLDVLSSYWLVSQGDRLKGQEKYELAVEKYEEAVKSKPNSVFAKTTLKYFCYDMCLKNYYDKNNEKTIYYGEKYLTIDSSCMEILKFVAYSYLDLKQYKKSADYYNKVLSMNPNDGTAKNNLECANYYAESESLKTAMNSVVVKEKAPSELYSLIVTNLSSGIRAEVEGILDVIWSVPDGRTLLTVMWQNKIPINIIPEDENADTHWKIADGSYVVTKVDIPIKFINTINNPNIDAQERIDYFTAFMHEFGHAYFRVKYPRSVDSLEEEIGTSMIGHNIAYKIITGNYINREQVRELAPGLVAGLSDSQHRELPVYSGYNQRMQSSNLTLPYPQEYTDIPSIYKKLLAEGKVTNVPNLDKLVK